MISTYQELNEVLALKVISTELMDCVEFATDKNGSHLKIKGNKCV